MIRTLIFVMSVLYLTGCAQTMTNENGITGGFSNKAASVGYRFLQKEYETLSPGVEFVLLKNAE